MIPQCYFSANKARARSRAYFGNWFHQNGERSKETQNNMSNNPPKAALQLKRSFYMLSAC